MTLQEIFKDDPVDIVSMDVPLLIRLLEWAHEDAKTDIEIHIAVENMIAKKTNLTMNDYSGIIGADDSVQM